MEKVFKQKKGITLIALVITIIVLLILAGISIAMLSGDNSILKKAGEARDITGTRDIEERIKLAYGAAITNGLGEFDEDTFKSEIEKYFGDDAEVSGDSESGYIVKVGEKIYTVGSTGSIGEFKPEEEATGIYVGTTKKTELEIDGAFMLSAESLEEPLTTVNSKYIWKSSNTNVATVTSEGIVICGNAAGETTITCSGANGTEATCKITTTANKATEIAEGAPTVPSGFTALDTATAKWKNSESKPDTGKGLVIVDKKGNEFVWVPVENAIYDSSKDGDLPTSTSSGTKNGKTYTPMAIETSNAANQDGIYKDGDSYTYKGILYNYDSAAGAYLMYPSATNKQGTSSQYREPDTVSSYDNGQTYTPTGSSEAKTYLSIIEENIDSKYNINSAYSSMTNLGKTMQSDYKKMIKSVATNKGFYIGRYESSLQNGKTRVVAGAKSMTAEETSANRWYGLYARQKNFAVNNGLTSVESDMIWGSQYDAMLNWMTYNSIDVTATGTRNTSRITGSVSTDKLNNIYDILGLRREWTLEAYDTYRRVSRGGYYIDDYSPSYRSNNDPSNTSVYYGSRPSLYIQ